MLRRNRTKAIRLCLNGGDDFRVLMSNVRIDELTREIEVLIPVIVIDVTPLRAGNHHGIEGALGRPRVKDVSAIVGENSSLGGGVGNGFHGSSVCHLFLRVQSAQRERHASGVSLAGSEGSAEWG